MIFLLLFFIGSVSAIVVDPPAPPIDYNHITNSNYDSTRTITSSGTFYLMEDITNANGIIISANDVILDCQGHLLNISSGTGIYSNSHENITIINGTIISNGYGIRLDNVNDSQIIENNITATDDYYGIYIENSYDITISGNTITSQDDDGIYIHGNNAVITGNIITTMSDWDFGITLEGNNGTILENTIYSNYSMNLDGYNLTVVNNTLTSGIYFNSGIWTWEVSGNTINDKIIYLYKNSENIGEIPSDAGQIIILNCTNGQISNLNLGEKAVVIYIENSSGITVENCILNPAIIEDYYIYIENSENCEFIGNTFNVSESNIVGGISAETVNNITITENTFNGIYVALWGDYFANSNIFNNIFENVSPCPLDFDENVSGTYIYLNDFINCSWEEADLDENVTYNSPSPVSYEYDGTTYSGIAGNYWSDYNETNATINEGIWSIPYVIVGSLNDSYPLVEPVNIETEENDDEDENDDSSSGSSGGGGSSYASDLSSGILSKAVKNAVSNSNVVYGNEIDEGYAEQLRETLKNGNNYELTRDTIIVGGPLSNGFAKQYNEEFDIPITNNNPGENRGVIQVKNIQVKEGNIIKTYQVIYIAGSDRYGTEAALEYFKTLDELPVGPIVVEWTANGPRVVE